MPIHVRWLDDHHHIILLQITGEWQVKHIFEARDSVVRMIDDRPGPEVPVHVIGDFSRAGPAPGDLLGAIPELGGSFPMHRLEVVSLVGVRSGLARVASRLMSRLYKIEYCHVASVEEALQKQR